MKVYDSREFQGLKVGVLSKESRSFLSLSKKGQKSREKGGWGGREWLVKDFYFSRKDECFFRGRRSVFSRKEEGGMRKEISLRADNGS
jgi:hypothetical protein